MGIWELMDLNPVRDSIFFFFVPCSWQHLFFVDGMTCSFAGNLGRVINNCNRIASHRGEVALLVIASQTGINSLSAH